MEEEKLLDKTTFNLDVTDWLRKKYGDEINPAITSIALQQDEESVCVVVTRDYSTEMGPLSVEEIFDMDIARDFHEAKGLDMFIEVSTFSPENNIMDNAKKLFNDKVTLENITSIFD